jgi:hypothetical protein
MSNSEPGVQPWWERPSVCKPKSNSLECNQPWWEQQPTLCSESSPKGCTFSFFSQLECKTEIGEDGVPIKRCEMLRKRLLNCPGREPMVDEQQEEITTSLAGTDHAILNDGEEGYHKERRHQSQSPDIGEALEHVIRLAEDLQEGFLPEDERNRVRCDTPPPARAPKASAASLYEGRGAHQEGLLSRYFKGNRMTNPRARSEVHWAAGSASASPSGSGEKEAPWRAYSKDFQDV